MNLAQAPMWLLGLVREHPKVIAIDWSAERTPDQHLLERARKYAEKVPPVSEGTRNSSAFSLAGQVRAIVGPAGHRLPEEQILAIVGEWNQHCTPPLGADELAKCVESSRVNGTPPADKPPSASRRNGSAKKAATPANDPQRRAETPKPIVLVPGPHITDEGEFVFVSVADFATFALIRLPEGALYRRGRVVGEIEGSTFHAVNSTTVRLIMDSHLRLSKWGKDKHESPVLNYVPSGPDHGALVLDAAAQHPNVRRLEMITTYPICMGRQFEIAAPGWNASHGIYLVGEAPAAIRNREHIQAILDDLVVDFPFATEPDRQNFFGLLLTPLVRAAIEGNVPLHLVGATIERTGKTKLVEDVLGGVLLGWATPALQLSGNEEERDKRIVAVLLRGTTILHLDNLAQLLDSPALASLITSRTYSGRLLGKSEMVEIPNMLTIVGTGNNVRASSEMSKRAVPINLLPTTDSPETRTDFRHPNLSQYVASIRRDVLGALLGMVENWRAAGMPMGPRPFGGFDAWAGVVGGILATQGCTEWLSGRAAWQGAADDDSADLRTLVVAWAEKHGLGTAVEAKMVFEIARDLGLFPRVFQRPTDQGQITTFSSKVLRASLRRPSGDLWIVDEGTGNHRKYRVQEIPKGGAT